MKKYWLIIRNTWDENFAYRLNFIMWRFRIVIRFLITYFLWSSIFTTTAVSYFGYTRETMLTYILLAYLVNNFVFATRTQELGVLINEGGLTNYLVKPVNFFVGIAARDVGDKFLNFVFSLFEFGMLFFIFQPQFFLQTNFLYILLGFIALFGSITMYFCLSLLLGFVGFWTTEDWAIRFVFIILLDFLAGNFFPIDILPPIVTKILLLTPFPYIFYYPVQLYLGRIPFAQMIEGFGVMLIWIMILALLVHTVWQRGLRVYSAEGR